MRKFYGAKRWEEAEIAGNSDLRTYAKTYGFQYLDTSWGTGYVVTDSGHNITWKIRRVDDNTVSLSFRYETKLKGEEYATPELVFSRATPC